MTLPYRGDKGVRLVQKLKRAPNKFLPQNVKPSVSFKADKLASRFNVKDKINIKHQNNVVYKLECPQERCPHTYIGETARRLDERISEHIFIYHLSYMKKKNKKTTRQSKNQ